MKRITLIFTLLVIITQAFSQVAPEDIPNFRKNDIVIDPFWLIGGLAMNVSYERIITEDAGLGANAIFGFGNSLEGFTQVSPYYRAYFGSKYASGFYIEGFLPITVAKDYEWIDSGREIEKKYSTGGLGFGLGGKWIAKKKFVFELNVGIARKFIGERGPTEPVTGKGMIGVGLAF